MRDLRVVVPVITPESNPQGRTPPSGFLTPSIFRLAGDAQPQAFSGIQKLVQQVYLEIMTDPLPNGIGSGMATQLKSAQADDFNAILQSAVTTVLDNIRSYQQLLDLAPDEKISDLSVIQANYDEINASFLVQLLLTAESGDEFVIEPPLT